MKLTIDLDVRCKKCGKRGAEERTGLCLGCIADEAEKVPVTPINILTSITPDTED